jgi:hypothetical protein
MDTFWSDLYSVGISAFVFTSVLVTFILYYVFEYAERVNYGIDSDSDSEGKQKKD